MSRQKILSTLATAAKNKVVETAQVASKTHGGSKEQGSFVEGAIKGWLDQKAGQMTFVDNMNKLMGHATGNKPMSPHDLGVSAVKMTNAVVKMAGTAVTIAKLVENNNPEAERALTHSKHMFKPDNY